MSAARVLPLLAYLRRAVRAGAGDDELSLAAVAAHGRGSRFELHRAFRRIARETPKQYALRLRLDHAAAELLRSHRRILDIALAAGFSSHEVFTRAFRRRLGVSPVGYRARGPAHPPAALARHAAIVDAVSPCVGVYHVSTVPNRGTHPMSTDETVTVPVAVAVAVRELAPQPLLAIRRRITHAEIAATLGEVFGTVFAYAQRQGFAFAGPPTTRYIAAGPGLITIEAGMPVAGTARGDGPIELVELPGGAAAVATHAGAYDTLPATHAAIERWLEANGRVAAGAPWEVYVTDPGEHPDPKDWRTEVFYPIEA